METLNYSSRPLIKCVNDEFQFYKEEESVVNELADCIKNQEEFLVCTPNTKLFFSLVIQTLCKDEMINFKSKDVPEKRAQILIITNRRHMLDFLMNCTVNAGLLFSTCSKLHQYLGYCNMDDPYFTRVYWRHFLYQYYKGEIANEIPLHYIYPIAVGYHTFHTISRGNRNVLGRKDGQGPVFYITDNFNILQEQNLNFDYTFVDCSKIKKPISVCPKRTLFFFETPLDDRIIYLQNYDIKNYIMTGNLLECIEDREVRDKNNLDLHKMLNRSSINSLDVEYVPCEFEDNIESILKLLEDLKRKKFSHYDTNTISKLIRILIRMPVSAGLYDLIASMQPYYETINDLLLELKNSERRYENKEFERVIIFLEDILYKYNLDNVGPKWEEMKIFILKECAQGKKVCIVSSNRVSHQSLKEIISISLGVRVQDLTNYGIQLLLLKDILDGLDDISCDSLIIYSAMNFRDLSPLLKINYKRAKLFLYSIEINLLMSRLKVFLDIKNYAVPHFKKNQERIIKNDLYIYLYNRFNKFNRRKEINLDEILAKLTEENTYTQHYILRESKDYKGSNAVVARLVRFNDDSVTFFKRSSKVQILDKKQKRIVIKKFIEVGVNDSILFIDRDARKDLYKVFINSIDSKDINRHLYRLIEKWRELYEEKFIELRIDDEQLYKKMKSLGWDKTTKSILRNWRNGYSYGPRDKEDIVFLGKVLGIQEFIDNADVYYDAMSKIRIEKRNVSRILNKLIYFSNKKIDHSDMEIIENYNLSVEQLKESLIIKQVREINKTKIYKVKPVEIGILFEES
ncbi:DISARM system-associated protein DrmE [Bacillus cereus]|uniref:DISARM system-associated protein DrmE n=1 Tax=Bacillus cereus TaxID=1396 RepID=UPI000A211065|nr:DISARM system-associated protein DrmE [Bacillus cereus]ARO59421.1 Uncharacterized protein B5E38_1859 [Bacillus cereus]PGW76554.1 hypothetical protein COE11_16245 [Bacillus cereus]